MICSFILSYIILYHLIKSILSYIILYYQIFCYFLWKSWNGTDFGERINSWNGTERSFTERIIVGTERNGTERFIPGVCNMLYTNLSSLRLRHSSQDIANSLCFFSMRARLLSLNSNHFALLSRTIPICF